MHIQSFHVHLCLPSFSIKVGLANLLIFLNAVIQGRYLLAMRLPNCHHTSFSLTTGSGTASSQIKFFQIDTTQSSLLITEPYFNLPNTQDIYDQVIFEEYEFAFTITLLDNQWRNHLEGNLQQRIHFVDREP